MDEERETTEDPNRRDFVSLGLAVLTVATVGFSLWACGDDLTFPGRIPPTSTPTRTHTPDETEEPTETPEPGEEDDSL